MGKECEGERGVGRSGGVGSQESAVISHETKAHSAQLWLVSHLESSLRAFEAQGSVKRERREKKELKQLRDVQLRRGGDRQRSSAG